MSSSGPEPCQTYLNGTLTTGLTLHRSDLRSCYNSSTDLCTQPPQAPSGLNSSRSRFSSASCVPSLAYIQNSKEQMRSAGVSTGQPPPMPPPLRLHVAVARPVSFALSLPRPLTVVS
eukprot:5681325-Pleurochrysis_carterae.AAC.1